MTDSITNEILFNILCDLKKKDLSMCARGRVISLYIKENNISINQASKDLGIPKTTIHTWARFNTLGEDKYKELINDGWTPSDIQKELKNSSVVRFEKKTELKRIDYLINEAKQNFNEFIHKQDYGTNTAQNIRELQNILNRILMRIEK
jgi:transposase